MLQNFYENKLLQHRPVLQNEVVTALVKNPNGFYIDATIGYGGHSRAILAQLNPTGQLLGIDRDPQALAVANELSINDSRCKIIDGNFGELENLLIKNQIQKKADGILLDLGVSSPQLDQPERGFSFLNEGPLDMRMDPRHGESAATWLAQVPKQELINTLIEYGEERFATRIANALITARNKTPLRTTTQLSTLIAQVIPSRELNKHPATRTFQAIRIKINNELKELTNCLAQTYNCLKTGGRLTVISFHSLEDRIVKNFLLNKNQNHKLPKEIPIQNNFNKFYLKPLGSPIRPHATEIAANPRARSAILRIAERLS